MSTFSENLKILRIKSGLKQSEIADLTGISVSTWSNYEVGRTEPNIDSIVKIASALQISVDSLFNKDLTSIADSLGDGVHRLSKVENEKKQGQSPPFSPPISTPIGVKETNLTSLSRIPKVVTVAEDGKDNVVMVPLRARAGYLAGYEDPEFIQTLPTFRLPGFNVGTFRAFEIYGHSMVPTFQESDIIMSRFVDNFNEIRDDRVYIIVSKREGVVAKRVINRVKIEGKLILNSDNQRHPGEYPPLIVDPDDILEIWYAVAFFSRQMRSPKETYARLNDMEARLTFIEANQKKLIN